MELPKIAKSKTGTAIGSGTHYVRLRRPDVNHTNIITKGDTTADIADKIEAAIEAYEHCYAAECDLTWRIDQGKD